MTDDDVTSERMAIMQEVQNMREAAYREGFDDGAKEAYAEGRRDQTDEFAELLPGPYYMDPPDGGDVSIFEQFRRMAEDAAIGRRQREHQEAADRCIRRMEG